MVKMPKPKHISQKTRNFSDGAANHPEPVSPSEAESEPLADDRALRRVVLPSVPRISPFEAIRMTNDYGQDYWSSRAMARLLNYREYRNFEPVIEKARIACKGGGHNESDHFVDLHEMIHLGKGAKRAVEAVQLSRYACYLVIQNADPSKDIVALGQTYFAVQTRRQELADQGSDGDEQAIEDQRRLVLRSEMREHSQCEPCARRGRQEGAPNHQRAGWNYARRTSYPGERQNP